MRGNDPKQEAMSSYVSPKNRVPAEHPLRPLPALMDGILKQDVAALGQALRRHETAVDRTGTIVARPAAAESLYRAQRMVLIKQLNYNLLGQVSKARRDCR